MSDGIVFRRIRGHIVPIKVSQSEKKDIKAGTSALAAGVGVATGSGAVYKKSINTAVKFAKRGPIFATPSILKSPQLSFADFARAQKASDESLKFMRRAKHLDSFASIVRKGGMIAGAGLIGYGASKLAKGLADKDNKEKAQAFGAAAGASIATAAFVAGGNPVAAVKAMANGEKQMKLFQASKPFLAKFIKGIF